MKQKFILTFQLIYMLKKNLVLCKFWFSTGTIIVETGSTLSLEIF